MTGVSAPVATRRRKGRSSRKELRRTVVQGETDADGLHCGGRREPGWTLLLYTGYDNEACPLSWAGPSVPCGETTDWRAGCGKSASPVRREGAAKAAPYPYRKSTTFESAKKDSTVCLVIFWTASMKVVSLFEGNPL